MDIQIDDILKISKRYGFFVHLLNGGTIETEAIEIHFLLKNSGFKLFIYNNQNDWHPNVIWHDKTSCPVCSEDTKRFGCLTLFEHLDEVFEKVMNHPKVRLRKLFF